MTLSKSALQHVVSNENVAPLDGTTNVAETIVSPVDSPSGSQPVATDTVVSTEPVDPQVVADVAAAAAAQPASDVPVDVQMVVETQNPTEMLGQATQEATVCQERADELLAMQHACEQYSKLLRQTGLEGISEEGAAFMKVGLDVIQRSLGTDLVVSKESFSDIHPRSSKVKVTISAESVKELASKAYDAFIEAIKKLVELMKKGWERLEDFGLDQERKIDALQERIKKIKINAASEEITIRNPNMLFADGDEVYPNTKGLLGLTHFALVAYPKAMEEYFSKVGTFIKGLGDFEVSDEEVKANLDSIAGPLTSLADDSAARTLFNGNHRVSVSANGRSFGIEVADGAQAPAEIVLPVEPPVKLRKQLEEIRNINNLLRDYRKSNDKVVKAADKLVGVANGIKDADSISRGVLSLIKDASPRNREIAEFVTKVTRAYIAVIEQQVAKHEAVKKA